MSMLQRNDFVIVQFEGEIIQPFSIYVTDHFSQKDNLILLTDIYLGWIDLVTVFWLGLLSDCF